MKILQVYSSPSPGGGTIHVADLTRALLERGHEVHVACRPETPISQWLADSGAYVHTLPLRNSLDLISMRGLSKLITQHGIDIIHGHTGRDYPLCWMARALAKRSKLIFSRHLAKANRVTPLSRRMFHSADQVLTVSNEIRTTMMHAFDLPAESVTSIPNWLDFSRYDSLLSQENARKRLGLMRPYAIAVMGGVIPSKGQAEFVESAIQLASKRHDIDFMIVGVNAHADPTYLAAIKQQITDSGLAEMIKCYDWVDDLRDILPALTLSIVPSWSDAFSIVVTESMAAHVPVVAYDAAGPAEIITHQQTGLLTPPRDVAALTAAITSLLNDEHERERLSTAAASDVRARFDRDTVITRIEEAYGAIDPCLPAN